jgi:predicted nucleic acid-binding protein
VRFVDTNVLLYAISVAPEERDKREIANRLLADRTLALSTQVLQEFYVQATRASSTTRLTHDQAERLVVSFTRFQVAEVTVAVVQAALATRERFGISYWDAAILEASRSIGCDVVLSEDLAHGQDYGGVRVENPFLAAT